MYWFHNLEDLFFDFQYLGKIGLTLSVFRYSDKISVFLTSGFLIIGQNRGFNIWTQVCNMWFPVFGFESWLWTMDSNKNKSNVKTAIWNKKFHDTKRLPDYINNWSSKTDNPGCLRYTPKFFKQAWWATSIQNLVTWKLNPYNL